jgi:TolB-like protein/Tfp pilus assembly protein PilF
MHEESPNPASTPTGAVFLSYASQDAEAAQRICAALRLAGVEVWFDQSELRGGDSWDRSIRRQIKTCALFLPVISRNTHNRVEGYFRLEWKLAVDRSHLIAADQAFLLPVVIDDTRDDDERVPERFREVQWTRLPAGETPIAFVERLLGLLSAKSTAGPEARSPAAAAAPPISTASRSAPALLTRISWLALLIGALAVIGVGYVALDKLVLSKRPVADVERPAATSKTAPVLSSIPEKSVAVLPFADLSEKHDEEYFSDGLSEELLDHLAQVPDLRVPGRTSSFYFKGKQATIAEIARALGVAHVLEGSVRKSGNTLRVTVQLIQADSGYQLWSKTYDRELKDIFKVQDEVAASVVESLKAKLASAHPASYRPSNPEAYNQFLLGRQLYNRGLHGDRLAVEAFRKSTALDPNYAAAYAGLAMAQSSVADFFGDAAMLNEAEANADKSVTLAPREADGYAARGYLRAQYTWDWAGAQADLAKALTLEPADVSAQVHYGSLLASLGRLTEAIAATRKAIELDPLSGEAWMELGEYLIANRDFGAANTALRRAHEIRPDSGGSLSELGTLQLVGGHADAALVTFGQISTDPVFRLCGIAMAEHALGHAKESQQALNELMLKFAQVGAYQIAETYAWNGNKEKSFEWLERAYQQRDPGLAFIKWDPLFANLRGDARYQTLVRKMNLPGD